MYRISFSGTGQCSTGQVNIDKTLEVDRDYYYRLTGHNSDEELTALIALHYPGVSVNPRHLSFRGEPL